MAIKIIDNIDSSKGETTLNRNPNLIHYCIPAHSTDWFDFRLTGIPNVYNGGWGASEISKLMRIEREDYAPVLPQLMEWKAGIGTPQRRMTEAMLSGILAEPTILERWQYYDGLALGYLDNYLANDKKRKCKQIGAYIVNKRFPWIFVSLDAAICQGYPSLLGEILEKDSPLECKTIGFQAAAAQKYRIPLGYVYQVHTQMLVTETDYAEIAILEGGNKFRVEHIEFDPEIAERILERTYEGWQTVLRLRELNAEKTQVKEGSLWDRVQEIEIEMQSILPLPGAGDGYDEYYTDKHIESGDVARGSLQQFARIRERALYAEIIKKFEERKEEIENRFKYDFVTQKVEVFDFDNMGKVKFTKRAGGRNFYPDFKSIKEKVDMNNVNDKFNKMITILNS